MFEKWLLSSCAVSREFLAGVFFTTTLMDFLLFPVLGDVRELLRFLLVGERLFVLKLLSCSTNLGGVLESEIFFTVDP